MGHTTEKLRGFLRFRLSLLHSVSYFFFLYRSPSSFLYTVFDAISVSGQALLESLWFSTACAAVTVHKNPTGGFLKLPNLHMLKKQSKRVSKVYKN